MKRISLEQLQKESKKEAYADQYRYILSRIEMQELKPVKNSPLNGKTPALHTSYWITEPAPDYSRQTEELKFAMVPTICTDYYLKHPKVYLREEKWVKLLNQYFLDTKDDTCEPASVNERSFQIFGREKFLQREQGKKILSHCGVSLEQLHVYHTTEPLACYSADKGTPQTVLILENKDTFYSMRKSLMDGANHVFGEKIASLIYGAGKGIYRSFEDFSFSVEPHINAPGNRILYFGDLDYEGIGIYEHLAKAFDLMCRIVPFVEAYRNMITKAGRYGYVNLPDTSDGQNRSLSGRFFSYFAKEDQEEMQKILATGKYVPQEILSYTDFMGEDNAV